VVSQVLRIILPLIQQHGVVNVVLYHHFYI